MASIEISPEINVFVKQVATEKGITHDEAAEHILSVGISRLSALRKYDKRLKKGEVGGAKAKAPKAAKEPKAAKAKTPKAAKAKGPLARKTKGAKAEAAQPTA